MIFTLGFSLTCLFCDYKVHYHIFKSRHDFLLLSQISKIIVHLTWILATFKECLKCLEMTNIFPVINNRFKVLLVCISRLDTRLYSVPLPRAT